MSQRVTDLAAAYKKTKPNLFDRAVNYFSPVRGAKRMHARGMMALAGGGYKGASRSSRATKNWITRGYDADTDILFDLDRLRSRSRDLHRNNPIARSAINTNAGNVIGSGLKYQSRINRDILGLEEKEASAWETKAEALFNLWARSTECDIERKWNFDTLQSVALTSMLTNGDVFINLPYLKRGKIPIGLKLQMIEADRVSNPKGNQSTNTLVAGVEKDNRGAPIAYHVSKFHPGKLIGKQTRKWDRLPAFGKNTGRRNVLHLFEPERVGQTRGVPMLAPVIESLKQLDDYAEAELQAAVIAAFFTVFTKTESAEGLGGDTPTKPDDPKDEANDIALGKGLIVALSPGEDIEIANPGRPNAQFDPFFNAVVNQIGASLDIPAEILLKRFTSSYSAARGAMLEAWKFFIKRRAFVAAYFCQPVFEAFLDETIASGLIDAPGYFSDPLIRSAWLGSVWVGPGKGMIDPLKEINAAIKEVELGAATISQKTAEINGGDWDRNHKQTVKELEARRKAGLGYPGEANGLATLPVDELVNEKTDGDKEA